MQTEAGKLLPSVSSHLSCQHVCPADVAHVNNPGHHLVLAVFNEVLRMPLLVRHRLSLGTPCTTATTAATQA